MFHVVEDANITRTHPSIITLTTQTVIIIVSNPVPEARCIVDGVESELVH